VLQAHERAVIATGGSLVTDPSSYELLLERCFCIWLKAAPEEHMARVIAQGDMRPFYGRTQGQGRSAALDEIRKLLADRDRLYARAPLAVETSGKTVRQTLQEIRKALP
jgi:XRE family aerobic/anaerobic benzoate catabolism transcriptional regulator